jgi:hypothetical protein
MDAPTSVFVNPLFSIEAHKPVMHLTNASGVSLSSKAFKYHRHQLKESSLKGFKSKCLLTCMLKRKFFTRFACVSTMLL